LKHGKNPTLQQKKLIKGRGLNPHNWLVIKNLHDKLIVMHREARAVKEIPKEVREYALVENDI
jgi:hypothetical protein